MPMSDFQILFESLPGLYLILTPDLVIRAVSDQYARATMTKREQIVGRHIFDVFPDNPEEAGATGVSNLHASLNRVVATKKPDAMAVQKYDIRRPEEEGGEFEERHWSPLNSPVLGAKGELVYIVHRVEDVTDFVHLKREELRKSQVADDLQTRVDKAEADVYLRAQQVQTANEHLRIKNEELNAEIRERRRVEAELQRSRMELQTYVDGMSTMNAKIAPDGTMIMLNKIAKLATGLSEKELMETNFLEGAWWNYDPAVRARVETAFHNAVAGTPITYEEKAFVFGRVVDIDFSLIPVRGTDGQVEYVIAEGRDICAMKATEGDLRHRSSQLEAANNELEAFSYAVSHDLRAPLRSIDGFSQALLEDYGEILDEAGRSYLNKVRVAAQRMALLIDELLDLSRLTRSEMVFEPVDLTAVARSVSEELAKIYPDRRQAFVLAQGATTFGDYPLLTILLTNLIGNAWKFSGKREDALVEFGFEQGAEETTFFIRDNGVGFDMAYADHLFGAFQRLHSVQEFDGTGIGLATAQRIVHRHGGRIWAEGQVGQGATFYFALPNK